MTAYPVLAPDFRGGKLTGAVLSLDRFPVDKLALGHLVEPKCRGRATELPKARCFDKHRIGRGGIIEGGLKVISEGSKPRTCTVPLIILTMFASGCANHPIDCSVGFYHADCLPGTAGYDNPDKFADADDKQCKSYGLQFGSPQYADCRLKLSSEHKGVRRSDLSA